ncbi:MAG: HD-GYP domain-containing protein (c-di-GMP phosphodiesterase class II) [Paraglaciecola sp.]
MHTKRIGRQGYAASYTLPIFNNGEFIGFVFFNSKQKDVFTENVLRQIDVYPHMISLKVISELTSIQTLAATAKTAGSITHVRAPETGSHLDRMSRYSRIIAKTLADKYRLDDEHIEHIFMFSPLHDIGKIGIPDNILLKPGKLNHDERVIMNTHATKGREIIDELLKNFELENVKHMSMLRNIAESHHEAMNGKGYSLALKGEQIPLEARIGAVADVFDALTSARSYKKAWSNEKAIMTLLEMAGEKLDVDCVNALIQKLDKVEVIQRTFIENRLA